jgi:hypothetical protein
LSNDINQAKVLMLFNDRDEGTGHEIRLATQMNDTFCEMILSSSLKSKILVTEPNTETMKQSPIHSQQRIQRIDT